MNSKKVVAGVMVLGVVMISVGLISAGWFSDLFKFGSDDDDLEGELAESLDVSITMANNPPHIESWTEPVGFFSSGDCDLPTTTVPITVTVSDPNGDDDLNTGSVTIKFTKVGESDRPVTPFSCSAGTPDGDALNLLDFTCVIDMYYYDAPGDWEINVYAEDNAGTPADNGGGSGSQISDGGVDYPYFTYGNYLAVRLQDSNDPDANTAGGTGQDTLEWAGISATSIDVDGTNNLIVENCGNVEISASGSSWLSVLGRDLESATDPVVNPDLIEPDSFLVDETVAPCTAGQELNKPASELDINGATLLRGSGATRNLYFCIQSINPTGGAISADSYTTQSTPNNWELNAAV